MSRELLLGVHLSLSKGILGVFEEAERLGIKVFQFFLGSPRVWRGKVFSEEEVKVFSRKKTDYDFICVHAPYLLNFASPDEFLYWRSIERALADIREMKKLGIQYYVFHPGTNGDTKEGINRIRKAMKEILEKASDIVLLVENTAGEKNDIGKDLDELKEIIDGFGERVGICLDTCHIFASGIDLEDEKSVQAFFHLLKKNGLLKALKLIHANDSKFSKGMRRDRHTHIGEGYIGYRGFKNLLKHEFFGKLPYILETPKENDMDSVNLERLRKIWNGNSIDDGK